MERLRELLAINRAIASSLDHAEILRRVVQKTAEFTRADACLLLLAGPDNLARVAASVGGEPDRLKAFAAPLDERINAVVRELLGFGTGDTFVGVPVDHGGRILGVLAVCRSEGTARPDNTGLASEEFLLSALADQAAIALEHADRLRRSEQTAAEAVAAENKFRTLLEAAPDPIVVVDRDSRIMLVNGEAERCFGCPREELLQREIQTLIPVRFRESHARHHTNYFAEPQLRPMGTGLELYALRADGSEFPVEVSLSPLETPDGMLVTATVRDITERKVAEQERTRLLESERRKSEQLILAVREAHHRIKNNLQAVSDLLSLELASKASADETKVLRESIERVHAIALVHDLLSHDQDVEHVDAGQVIERLVPHVLRSTGLERSAVQVRIEAVSFPLPSKKATTLALILNELLSNAAKHAFADRLAGTLLVRFTDEDGGLLLVVQDDGPGLSPDFDPVRHANVGMQVIMTLARNDLRGRLSLTNSEGLRAAVWFPR